MWSYRVPRRFLRNRGIYGFSGMFGGFWERVRHGYGKWLVCLPNQNIRVPMFVNCQGVGNVCISWFQARVRIGAQSKQSRTIRGYRMNQQTQAPKKRKIRSMPSKIRSAGWSTFLAFTTDGIAVSSRGEKAAPIGTKQHLPSGPLIIVANHQSHADSAVLSAAFGRERPLIFAAGAEYWGAKWYRKLAGLLIMGVLPIRRGKSGWEDLTAATEAIKKGGIAVLYPEGTRSQDGTVGEFKTGAFRLAQHTGAQILPVAIVGTEKILPKNGKYKRAGVELLVGTPSARNEDTGAWAVKVRGEIELLRAKNTNLTVPGRTWTRVSKLVATRAGIAFLVAWTFSEALIWPLIAELPLILLASCAVTLRRGIIVSAWAAGGSVAGVYLHWWLVKSGVNVPLPLTTERMYERAVQDWATPLKAGGAQASNGVPIKVYAQVAGDTGLGFWVVAQAMVLRVTRIMAFGVLAAFIGEKIKRYTKPSLGIIQSWCFILFITLLWLIVRSWS